MHISTLPTLLLLFAASTLALPAKNPTTTTLQPRTPPSTELTIRGWNTSSGDCNWDNPHAVGEMGPSVDVWGDYGNYDSYSLSRDLAANETLQLFSQAGGDFCATLIYPVSGLQAGCYQTSGTAQLFSCMRMVTSS
ncbi:MAG: hypothetical protein ALECFALPRED_002230 [Alectoria fallacina]|uniref:Uncharacterized protein n=1 Tax=Alectoria fallacina TaxID=1903189 RepID=A0A8H3FKT3_9LECA|nr:MAG: hypothetical protein ALECFALPRED_002230 [Alectoria fallacina]